MMPIEVNALLAVLGEAPSQPPYARPPRRVTHLCWDSREVTDQSIFVAFVITLLAKYTDVASLSTPP